MIFFFFLKLISNYWITYNFWGGWEQKKTKTSQIIYMVIINNNFSVNNRYVISEQCCSVLVSATNWIFSENSGKNTNLITKYTAIEIWSYLGSKLSNKVHEHTYQIRCFWCQNMVKFLYIFILYIVVIKTVAAIFF